MIFISLSNPVFAFKQALTYWLTQAIKAYRKSMQTANYPRKSLGSDNWQRKKGEQTRPSPVSGYSTRTSLVGLNISKSFRINIKTAISALDWGLIWSRVFTTLGWWAEVLKELYWIMAFKLYNWVHSVSQVMQPDFAGHRHSMGLVIYGHQLSWTLSVFGYVNCHWPGSWQTTFMQDL